MTEPTTELGKPHAEIAALRREVIGPRRQHARAGLRHGWLDLVIDDLETNLHTQYKMHLYGAIYWLINFPLVVCLFFFTPDRGYPLWVAEPNHPADWRRASRST